MKEEQEKEVPTINLDDKPKKAKLTASKTKVSVLKDGKRINF